MSLQALRTPSKWRSFASLRPVPPGASKSQDTRDLDIHEDNQLDELSSPLGCSKRAFCPANVCEREVAMRCIYDQTLTLAQKA